MANRSGFTNARVVGGFALPVILSALIGFVTVPALIAGVGQEQWGLIYLAQVVGQIGGVAVAFGWGVTGPAMVAAAPVAARVPLFRQSLIIRAALFAVTAPAAIAVLLLLTRGDVGLAVLGGIAYLLPLLGGGWFFIGEGSPSRLLLWDAIPGLTGTIAGAIAAVLTGSPELFLLCQGLGYVLAVVLTAAVILRRDGEGKQHREEPRRWSEVLQEQRPAVVTSATATLYAGLPVIAVTWFIPQLQSTFSLAHLLFRYCTIAFTPIQQFFQSWVPADAAQLRGRIRIAGLISAGISVVAGILLAVLGPVVAALLSAGDATRAAGVTWALTTPFGVALAAVCASSVVGLACLVALGRTRDVAISTVVGASVGAPLILLAAWSGQPVLVAWAFAVSEIAVTSVQLVALRRHR